MESEWITYIRENAPELVPQMEADRKWGIEWRDDHIRNLTNGILDVIADMDGRIENACEMLQDEERIDSTVTKGYIDGMREAMNLLKNLTNTN